MRHFSYYINLFFLFGICLSGCTIPNISKEHRNSYLHQLSSEIESTVHLRPNIPDTSIRFLSSKNSVQIKKCFSENYKIKKSKNQKSMLMEEEQRSPLILKPLSSKSIIKIAEKDPIDLNKHDNFFWKFGGILFMIGLALFFISALILLKSNSRNKDLGYVLLGGLLIGLGFIIISLPFILIGAIIG